MKKIIILTFSIFLISIVGAGCSTIPINTVECLTLGQEWKYKTREGEEGSRLVVIDSFINKKQKIIYIIRITGIDIKSPYFKNYYPDGVPYIMISEAGLHASLTEFVGKSQWNQYYDEYFARWKKEFPNKSIENGTVKGYLNTLEEVLNINLGA